MDWMIMTIAALLLITLGAFFLDIIPYPVGAALFSFLFVLRPMRKIPSGK